MKEIPLTRGYVALVDDEDYEWLSQWKWHALVISSSPRAVRNASIANGGSKGTIYMSRQIVDAPPGMPVDHQDHDTLNNQRSNLRVCTYSQNNANRRKTAGCTSRFKGVYWNKGCRKWCAQIKLGGLCKYLGLFVDEVKAAQAYNREAVCRSGEFALLNDVHEES